MCGKVRHAVSALACGCDFVVAQGTEAGGHTGTVATMALVPQVVDAVGEQVPVVAAGGLYDGRGLAASLALGADGVWIGTRFIATPEARSVDGYKETLLATPEDGTVISRAFTGKTCRVVRNEWTQHFEEHPEELQPFPDQVVAATQAGVNHLGASDGHRRRRAPRVHAVRSGRRRDRRARPGRSAGRPHHGRGRTGTGAGVGHGGRVTTTLRRAHRRRRGPTTSCRRSPTTSRSPTSRRPSTPTGRPTGTWRRPSSWSRDWCAARPIAGLTSTCNGCPAAPR